MNLTLLCQSSRLCCWKHWRKRSRAMRVQVVQDQNTLFCIFLRSINELTQKGGPLCFCATRCDAENVFPCEWFTCCTSITCPFSLLFIVFTPRFAGFHWERIPFFITYLFPCFIHTHVRKTWIIGAVIHISDIFHVIHEFLIRFSWNALPLVEPGFAFIPSYNKADRFSSHVFSSFYINHFFSQESSAPSSISGWCFHTGQCDQLRFLPPCHLPLLWSFWLFSSMQRLIQSVLQKTTTDPPDGCRTYPKCFSYSFIRPVRAMCSTIRFQEYVRMLDCLCMCISTRNHVFSTGTLLFCQLNALLHTRYVFLSPFSIRRKDTSSFPFFHMKVVRALPFLAK